jgi:hypothetical protein
MALTPETAIAALQPRIDELLGSLPTAADRLTLAAVLHGLAEVQDALSGLRGPEPPPDSVPAA